VTEGMEITMRDVYELGQHTASAVTALAAQVGALSATVTLQLASGSRRMDDQEARLRTVEQAPKVTPQDLSQLDRRVSSLESSRGKMTGVGLTLMALTGVAAVLVEHVIGH